MEWEIEMKMEENQKEKNVIEKEKRRGRRTVQKGERSGNGCKDLDD